MSEAARTTRQPAAEHRAASRPAPAAPVVAPAGPAAAPHAGFYAGGPALGLGGPAAADRPAGHPALAADGIRSLAARAPPLAPERAPAVDLREEEEYGTEAKAGERDRIGAAAPTAPPPAAAGGGSDAPATSPPPAAGAAGGAAPTDPPGAAAGAGSPNGPPPQGRDFAAPLAAGRALLWDDDPGRAAVTAGAVADLAGRLGLAGPVGVHVDAVADRELGGRASRGAARGGSVFIRPGGFDPAAPAGRRLLAHEFAHVAQSRLGGDDEGGRLAAEAEAAAVADAYAAGRGWSRPSARLAGSARAYDDGDDAAQKAREDELLKVPRKFKPPQVTSSGLRFEPDPPGQKWLGNIDRQLQAEAVQVKGMVGKNYSVQLVRDAVAYLDPIWFNLPPGPAAQDEVCKPITMRNPLPQLMVDYFTNVRKPPVPLVLTAEQLKVIRALADLKKIFNWLKANDWIVFPWYTEPIFISVMLNNGKLLEEFQAAGDDDAKLNAAQLKRSDQLEPYEHALDAIRGDAALTDEGGYRALWNLPAKDPASPERLPPVDKNSEVDARLAVEFLLDVQANHPADEVKGRVYKDAAYRRKLFDDWAVRMRLKKIDLEGNTTVRDAPGRAVQAPDPATMYSHPPLESPFYDRQAGTEMLFWMNVYTPNMWEHFIPWHYYWEVIRVPHDEWAKREDVATDPGAHGEDYGGFGRILGSRVRRSVSNAGTDIKRSLARIDSLLGPPSTGPTTLAAAGGALSAIGSVIKTAFGKFSEKPWEYTAAIKEPGVYVVRCRATRPARDDDLIRKMPSVTYLPIWVRPPEDILADRVAVERATAEIHDDRLNVIQEKLKDKTLPADERKRLEAEARDLVATIHGNAETQLGTELGKLNDVKKDRDKWGRLDKKEQADLDQRVADIEFILAKRSGWVSDLGSDASGQPEKLVAYFVTQEGPSANRPMRLLLETVRLKSAAGTEKYAVLDSTSKEGEHRIGDAKATRADAISDAVTKLLEDVGYGRGKVTIAIPKGIWDVGAKAGETRTIDIQRSAKQLAIEGLENLALVGSIALIAAAPFTGGESLALLVPLGVVGAIPSAYRLAHRASEGTFEWDMNTAMDVLNVLGAAAGVGQFASGVKLIRVSANVWMYVGLGMDGLQGLVGTYDLIDKLSKIDPTLPSGAREAEAMAIVGNAMLQLGIAIGGRLAAEGKARKDRIAAKSTPEANPNIVRAPEEMVHPLTEAGIKDVPVLVDNSIEGPEARVHLGEPDGYDLPSDLYIIAGKGATPDLIRLHIETIRLLQKYSGFSGWVRTLWDRINALRQSKQFVKPGSRGWNAAAEVEKIKGIVAHYTQEIADGKVSSIDGNAYLEFLKKEMARHQQALNEVEEGAGFIAAQAPKSADAVSHGYPAAPPNHYYVEESPGVFQLRAHVGYDGPAKMVVPKKTGPGYDVVDRPAEGTVAAPGTAGATPTAGASRVDTAQLQLDVSRALGVSSSYVKVVSQSGKKVRVVPPAESGTGYVVHVPADATSGAVERAVARHNDLTQQRPPNLAAVPTDAKGRPTWTGAMEAEFRGRPAADEGYHWRLQDGKLQYVREVPEEGTPAKPKMVWDEKAGQLVPDAGAKEAKAWPPSPPTDKATAFDDLGGNNPASAFGKWVAIMESLGTSRGELIAALQDPTGRNYDTVRHNLKGQQQYQDAIRKWMTDPAELRKRFPEEFRGIDPADAAKQDAALRKAQHRAVVDVDTYLALKDATVWTEKWYIELYGKVSAEKGATVTKVETQVHFDKEKLNAAGIDVSSTRQADAVIATETAGPANKPVERNTLKDVKSHKGPISADDKAQYADYKKLIGKDVPRTDGTTTRIDAVGEIFLDPRGGKANAEWMVGELFTPEGRAGQVQFELFNTKGDRRLFTGKDVQKLRTPGTLQAAIIAFCDG